MLMDSGMRSISNYDSMPYTIVTSLEMSDEPQFLILNYYWCNNFLHIRDNQLIMSNLWHNTI